MEALKLPSLKLPDLPRPTRWDFYAIGALVVSFWGPKWLARRWREPPEP